MKQLFFLCALLLAMSLFGAPAKDASRGVDIKSAVNLSAIAESTNAAGANDAIYASPGKLVSADGTRLNLYCMGSGSPAVVFDSG